MGGSGREGWRKYEGGQAGGGVFRAELLAEVDQIVGTEIL